MTKDIGIHGNLFGGTLLAWIDEAGALYAAEKMSSKRIVTAHIDGMDFKKPVKEGDHVHFHGTILRAGKTSLTIIVEVAVVTPNGERQPYTICAPKLVFVHIGDDGHSTPFDWKNIPEEFIPVT